MTLRCLNDDSNDLFLKICVEYDVEDIEIMEERLLAELEAQANILNNMKFLKFKDTMLFLKISDDFLSIYKSHRR